MMTKYLMRLLFVIILLGLFALFSLWMLTGQAVGSKYTAVPASAIPTPNTSGHVTVWAWNIAAESLKKITPEFSKKYPHVDVNVDMTGARMQTRLMLSLASGVGAPDVSQFEIYDARRFIATGQLADLTPVAGKYKDLYPAYLWDNCQMNGHVYAIPWDMGPCGVYYRRDIFAKYGINPNKINTWDDYIAAGKRILQLSNGQTKMLPLGVNGLRGLFLIFLQQTGGQIFDDQGRIAVNTPQARQALDMIKKMRMAGICSDIPQWSQEFLSSLNDNSIATYPIGVWFGGTIKDMAKDSHNHAVQWGAFRLPAMVPGGIRVANDGGSVLVIPSQSKNKAAAWAFIHYALCTREGELEQYKYYDIFPAYLPALKSPIIDAPDPFYGGQRVGRLFAMDVTKIAKLNLTPNWSEAGSYMDQALSEWASTGMHNKGFFAELERKMQQRLGVPISPLSLSLTGGAR
jgi:lactose/L-arabinose transport system substrate-binding protein